MGVSLSYSRATSLIMHSRSSEFPEKSLLQPVWQEIGERSVDVGRSQQSGITGSGVALYLEFVRHSRLIRHGDDDDDTKLVSVTMTIRGHREYGGYTAGEQIQHCKEFSAF